jgi:hypothetical protein
MGCHLPNSPWPGRIKLFPARDSLVSDTTAGDGKTGKQLTFFLLCIYASWSKAVLIAQVKVFRLFYSLLFESWRNLALLDFLDILLNLALLDLIILNLYPSF